MCWALARKGVRELVIADPSCLPACLWSLMLSAVSALLHTPFCYQYLLLSLSAFWSLDCKLIQICAWCNQYQQDHMAFSVITWPSLNSLTLIILDTLILKAVETGSKGQ